MSLSIGRTQEHVGTHTLADIVKDSLNLMVSFPFVPAHPAQLAGGFELSG